MMRVSEAALALNAMDALGVEHRGENVLFTSVGTDSRHVTPGELFIALRGPHFDAHQHIAAAQAAGAVAAMADVQGAPLSPVSMPLITVNDTRQGLTQLAQAWRSRFTMPLVALTGSSGKTTVKEMLAAILQGVAPAAVLATRGNLNNEIGVPLTLLELRAEHRYAVIELGMNHAGEISRLTQLAQPDVALINNAGRAHIEYLGSTDAIASAKGEILEGLASNGVAVLNADDAYAPLWYKLCNKNKYLRFGLDLPADIGARYELHAMHSVIHFNTPAGTVSATLHAPGLHNVRNALAACAAAIALDVPLAAIAAGIEKYAGVKGRLQKKSAPAGATLIDDSYNANPESMRAAIDVLARAPGRRVLILGDMGELGERAAVCHTEVGAYAREAGIETLYALGDMSAHAVAAFGAGARHFVAIDALIAQVQTALAPDVTLLVKGSRFMQMERVADALEALIPAQTQTQGEKQACS
jgi:UDP-N-acetylmuramoyl-tripeptide--D-alanyl-D-alanine ligase